MPVDLIEEKLQSLLEIKNNSEFRTKLMNLQDVVTGLDGSLHGKNSETLCPLKHSFGEGCYIREIFMPADTLVVSKLHKITHPYFVLKGKVTVATEDGTILIEAPFQGMTQAGTKRALYIHEDTVWITVHVTDKTDLAEIEAEIIAKDYEEYEIFKNRKILSQGCKPINEFLGEAMQ